MFLYYIPDHPRGTVTRADFEALGLGYALGLGDPTSCRVNANGPEGHAGFAVTIDPPPDAPPECRVNTLYEPAKQTWRKGPGGKYWVGYYKGRRPTPASLARAKLIAGEPTKLRGGEEWLIPIARSLVRGTTLPQEMVIGDDFTTWQTRELPEYFELCRAAERVVDILRAGKPDEDGRLVYEIPYSEGMPIVVRALSVNYRVSAAEVSMLGVTNDDMWAVLRAICDVPALLRMTTDREQKKTPASESSSTDDGSPGNSPDTSPPSPT